MKLSKNALIGYPAGIVTGVTYGLNPLFAIPMMVAGASVQSILFFRYAIAVALLGIYLCLRHENFRVNWRQAAVLLALGALYTCSSLFLFKAYNYIPSGLATTLVFLYPALVALIMVFLGKIPSWPVWLSIAFTFAGVVIMTGVGSGTAIDSTGIIYAVASALAYALFIVVINQSKVIAGVSDTLLTFYSLLVGTVVFTVIVLASGKPLLEGISGATAWLCLVGLALLPTIISTASLAIATRKIGPSKASVLGVFEPITAILVGTVAFGEPLTTGIVVGIIISVAAVAYMIQVTKR